MVTLLVAVLLLFYCCGIVYGLWWHGIRAATVRPRCHELLSLMVS